MPSKSPTHESTVIFWPLLVLTGILWLVYRAIFKFDVWFDETIGKAIFFGLPVWAYITVSRSKSVVATFSHQKLYAGLLLGIAIGGIYGFVGSLIGLVGARGAVQAVPLYLAEQFWWEFFLAFMTAVWETLFFFSWIMVIIQKKLSKRSLLHQVLLVALIFTLFHVPNSLLRFPGLVAISQIGLMFAFGLGQALIFARWRNFYTLVISHAIWGMVLLVHLY